MIVRRLTPSHLDGVLSKAGAGQWRGSTPGAILLLDAEGSTALSTRLREHGTVGAEALADVLNEVFDPVVESVIRAGGFIAHFTGDGVVAAFPGGLERVVPTAIRAGATIMDRLVGLGEIATLAGPIRLRVRAIVGAGEIHWLLWRSEGPRESQSQNAVYAYVGSALAEAQRGEEIVAGGALGVGPVAARFVPEGATMPLDDGYRRLFPIGSPLPNPHDGSTVITVDAEGAPRSEPTSGWRFVGPGLDVSPVRGEFRPVVCVFVQLRDTPAPGPEGTMQIVLAAASRHGGYVGNALRPGPADEGITLLLLWGAPNSDERDVELALRFVAELRSSIDPSNCRIGATFDTVFAGYVGGESQETYTVVGRGVNLAARLCGLAPWAAIRADDSVAPRLPSEWLATDLGLVPYKGFARPVPTFDLETTEPSDSRSGWGRLVGRELEVDELESALAPLMEGMPVGIVAIVGEAGIGKSHLVAEVRDRAAQVLGTPRWISVEAGDAHHKPFGVLQAVVRSLLGAASDHQLVDRVIELLADHPDPSEARRVRRAIVDLFGLSEAEPVVALDPEARFDNIVVAFEEIVDAVAEDFPLVIAISAEWLDSATGDALARVRDWFVERAVAVVVESRSSTTLPKVDRFISLDGLTHQAVTDLATEVLGAPPGPVLDQLLSERTAGNPYFVTELAAFVRRTPTATSGANQVEAGAADLPMDLQHVLVARLDAFEPAVRDILLAASVLGTDFDENVLAEMLSVENWGLRRDVELGLAAAVEARAVEETPDGHRRFRHALLRDAAYGMQLHSTVKRRHLIAARSILAVDEEPDRHADLLAHHYTSGGAASPARRWYVRAADRAAERFANGIAIENFTRALDVPASDDGTGEGGRTAQDLALAPPEVDRYDVLRRMWEVQDRIGDLAGMERTLAGMEQAVTTTDTASVDPRLTRADLLLLRARTADESGRFLDAAELVDRGLAILDDLPDSSERELLQADLLLEGAATARYRGQPVEATAMSTRAIELLRRSGASEARAENLLAGIAWDQGDFTIAAARHRSAADIARREGDHSVETTSLNGLGTALFGLGDYSQAAEIHERGAQRCREIGLRRVEAQHLGNLAGSAWAVGDYELAIERYREALAICERTGQRAEAAIHIGNVGDASRLTGDFAMARSCFEQALQLDREIGRRRGEAFDLHGLGLVLADLDERDAAADRLREAVEIRDELGESHLANESRVALAAVLDGAGQRSEAIDLVDQALDGEPDPPFAHAVEPTATVLRALSVLEPIRPDRAAELEATALAWLRTASERIADPVQRNWFLTRVEANRQLGERS